MSTHNEERPRGLGDGVDEGAICLCNVALINTCHLHVGAAGGASARGELVAAPHRQLVCAPPSSPKVGSIIGSALRVGTRG